MDGQGNPNFDSEEFLNYSTLKEPEEREISSDQLVSHNMGYEDMGSNGLVQQHDQFDSDDEDEDEGEQTQPNFEVNTENSDLLQNMVHHREDINRMDLDDDIPERTHFHEQMKLGDPFSVDFGQPTIPQSLEDSDDMDVDNEMPLVHEPSQIQSMEPIRTEITKGNQYIDGDLLHPNYTGEPDENRKGFSFIFGESEWTYCLAKYLDPFDPSKRSQPSKRINLRKFHHHSLTTDKSARHTINERARKAKKNAGHLFQYEGRVFKILEPISEKFESVKSWVLAIASYKGSATSYPTCMMFFKYELKMSRMEFTLKELYDWAVLNGLKNGIKGTHAAMKSLHDFLMTKQTFVDVDVKKPLRNTRYTLKSFCKLLDWRED